jgi:hypothetical protein
MGDTGAPIDDLDVIAKYNSNGDSIKRCRMCSESSRSSRLRRQGMTKFYPCPRGLNARKRNHSSPIIKRHAAGILQLSSKNCKRMGASTANAASLSLCGGEGGVHPPQQPSAAWKLAIYSTASFEMSEQPPNFPASSTASLTWCSDLGILQKRHLLRLAFRPK